MTNRMVYTHLFEFGILCLQRKLVSAQKFFGIQMFREFVSPKNSQTVIVHFFPFSAMALCSTLKSS